MHSCKSDMLFSADKGVHLYWENFLYSAVFIGNIEI